MLYTDEKGIQKGKLNREKLDFKNLNLLLVKEVIEK